MMTPPRINLERMLGRLDLLGRIGRNEQGILTRLACSDADRKGRDAFVGWARDAGLGVHVDAIGNIFAIWKSPENASRQPILMGSHIDTVVDAGMLDGTYGVLAGLEVIQTLKESGFSPAHPLAVAAFTNEEGVRFAPDMMGSAVFAGTLGLEAALASGGAGGETLGGALRAIGYDGPEKPGFLNPHLYLELHIEQGPILDRRGIDIGVVESVQGISWLRLTLAGEANHAGTTPMSMRRDAGLAAAKIVCFANERAAAVEGLVVTAGTIQYGPGAINVVPGNATLTLDIRSPSDARLQEFQEDLAGFLTTLEGIETSTESLARTPPVHFDRHLADVIEQSAKAREFSSLRMASGAGHDAQVIANVAPTAMIFVLSVGGISHNPKEYTPPEYLERGAQVLLDTVASLCMA